jgi:Bacterial membrane protein YfhO
MISPLKTITGKFGLLLAIVVIVVAVRSPGVFKGECLLPTDTIWGFAPWKFDTPSGASVQNVVLSDTVQQFYPWTFILHRSLNRGKIPLWNPGTYCGVPFLANPQAEVLHPHRILLLFLGPNHWFTCVHFLRFIAAAGFTFLFLKRLGMGFTGCIAGGVSFGLCGPMTVWATFPVTDTAAMLPAVLYGVERWIQDRDGIAWAYLAGFTGMLFLGGHIELAFLLFVFPVWYGIWRIWEIRTRINLVKSGLVFGTALMIGIILTAGVYLPFSEYLSESAQLRLRSELTGVHGLMPPQAAWTMLFPDRFGSPVRSGYSGPLNYNEIMGYTAITLLPLAILGISLKNKQVRMIAILGCFAAGCAFGVPGFTFLAAWIPGWKLCWMSRLIMFVSFAVAVAGAAGFDALDRITRRHTLSILVLICMTALIAFYIADSSHGKISQDQMETLHHHLLLQNFLLIVSGCLVLLRIRYRAVCLTGLIILDLTCFGWGYLPTQPAEWVFPKTHEIRQLQDMQANYRTSAGHPALFVESHLVYRMKSINGYDCMIPWRIDRVLEKLRKIPGERYQTPLEHYENPLWDMLSVKGLLLDRPPIATDQTPLLATGKTFRLIPDHFDRSSGIRIVSSLDSEQIFPAGHPIAHLKTTFRDGSCQTNTLSSGIHIDRYQGGLAEVHRTVYDHLGNPYTLFQSECTWNNRKEPIQFDISVIEESCRIGIQFIEPLGGRWKPIEVDRMYLYENTRALPLVRLVSDWRHDSESDALNLIATGQINPRQTVTLSNSHAGLTESHHFTDTESDTIQTTWSTHKITTLTSIRHPRYLVVGQTWFPGWRASIDQMETPVHLANSAFMAVKIPAGQHRVVLEYYPLSYLLGLFLALISISITISVFVSRSRL